MDGVNPDYVVEHPLTDAARKNDIDVVYTMLYYGTDPNVSNSDGVTALSSASFNGNVRMMKMLIDAGADINGRATGAQKPTHGPIMSASGRSREALRLLLDLGADVNLQRSDGVTALMCAVNAQRIDAVRMLLDAGADPNLEDSHGRTAAQIAREQYHNEEIAQMIERAESK